MGFVQPENSGSITDPRLEGGLQGPASLSEIAGGTSYYGPGGVFEQLADGSWWLATRKGTLHPGSGAIASIVSRTCAAGLDPSVAANWSADTTIVANGGNDHGTSGGGVTASGRRVVFYRTIQTTGSHLDTALSFIYSDDGSTWSSPVVIDTGAAVQMSNFGRLVADELGNYYMVWFRAETGNYIVSLLKSTDNCATFAAYATISPDAYAADETSVVYIGGGRMLALQRLRDTAQFGQSVSADYGATWTQQANVTFATTTTRTPPNLRLYTSPNGVAMVRCYWFDRDRLVLRYIDAPAASVYADPAAWMTVGYGPFDAASLPSADSGYPCVIHPDNDFRAYGWMYTTPTYHAVPGNIELFALPANRNTQLAQLLAAITPSFPGKTDATKNWPALTAAFGALWLEFVSHLRLDGQLKLTSATSGFVELPVFAADPNAPAAGSVRVYMKSGGLFYRTSDGTVHAVTAT